ncbi:MAG: PqiC family protein [Opitutales bacterium]
MKATASILILVAATLLFSPSCVSVIPESTHVKPANYLLAESITELPPADSDFLNGAFFYVRPVELAPYLGKNHIVTRTSANKVLFSELHRWGEPLCEGIARVVGKNLSGLLGTLNYSAYPNRKKSRNDFEIGITIDRFERISGGKVSLVGSWQLYRDNEQAHVAALGETIAVPPSSQADTDKTSEVAALSQVLRKVSERIAADIVRRRGKD